MWISWCESHHFPQKLKTAVILPEMRVCICTGSGTVERKWETVSAREVLGGFQ
jgi:hypothetical protein